MTTFFGTALEATALLSRAAYRLDADSTAGENDLTVSLGASGWSIIRPSQLGLSTLDPDNEYFEVRVGNASGPIAAAFLAERNGVLAISFRGSDESGDQVATINNQSGYFASYRGFLDAALLYASDSTNAITEVTVTGHSLGGVMAEWMAEEYSVAIADLELQTSISTFGSPGTNITTPPSELAQSILHFGHTSDPIFQHQGFIGGFLSGFVREGVSIEIDLPNVNSNDPRLNFNEHDMFLYERSVPALIGSYFGARNLNDPSSHQIIVDTVIAAADDQVTLDYSSSTVSLAIIGNSGVTTPGFADIDVIKGGSAGDWLDGGSGDDTLFGLDGDDVLFGGEGFDAMFGGVGYDSLYGDLGDDQLAGGDQADYLNGDVGADTLSGEAGNDTLDGGAGADYLIGSTGTDSMYAGAGDDVMQGGDDADYLDGNSGADTMYGDAGDDVLDSGADLSSDADYVDGGDGNDTLYGRGGNDTMVGGTGFDALYGDDGADYLFGGGGNDYLGGQNGGDFMQAGNGDDSLDGGASADYMEGNDGADSVYGGDGNDVMHGGSGNDFLNGQNGSDTIYGEDGNDVLDGGNDSSNDYLDGGALGDAYIFGAGMGHDVIGTFDDTAGGGFEDYIYIDYNIVANFAAISPAISQSGANVIINLGGYGGIQINNIILGNLGADDFIFY